MIRYVQLDPNGICNSRCWFCPVAYSEKSKNKEAMSLKTLQHIFGQFKKYRTQVFSEADFVPIFTAHYNEVFLYKHFFEMLDLIGSHFMKAVLFSNGTTLNEKIIRQLKKYDFAFTSLTLNIPAFERDKWIKCMGLSSNKYDLLMENIKMLYSELSDLVRQERITIQVNGPSQDLDETHEQARMISESFPKMRVRVQKVLVDRAGYLADKKIINDFNKIQENKNGKSRVGSCGYPGGSRMDSWLHINKNGDTFLCCNDFKMEYVFGNLLENELADILNSSKRDQVLIKAVNNICPRCVHAQWI